MNRNYRIDFYRPLSAAEKMMQKMGYKEGEGLGRNKQGMSMALQVEKTGKRSGRIIHEKDVSKEPTTPPVALPPPVVIPSDAMKHQSKVILLKESEIGNYFETKSEVAFFFNRIWLDQVKLTVNWKVKPRRSVKNMAKLTKLLYSRFQTQFQKKLCEFLLNSKRYRPLLRVSEAFLK